MTILRAVGEPLAGGTEAGSVSTTRLWKRMKAQCVCATARFSSLRGSGISAVRLAVASARARRGRSKPRAGPPLRGARLQVHAVGLVELGRARIRGPAP